MIFQNKQTNTLDQTLACLKHQGYQLKFRREAGCIYCFEMQEWIMPENFTVDESYYFGDVRNPDADRILYAISLADGNRGSMVDACNVYADNISNEMEQKLQWKYPLLS